MNAETRDRLARAACDASAEWLREYYHRNGTDQPPFGNWDDLRVPDYQRDLYRVMADAVVAELKTLDVVILKDD